MDDTLIFIKTVRDKYTCRKGRKIQYTTISICDTSLENYTASKHRLLRYAQKPKTNLDFIIFSA